METYNLLVIDDDPNIRKLLSELLSGRPEFNLLIAGDGQEAVRQFAEKRIDMVLTDIHMPGFTGLELMADMKKINFKPEILVMTANATPENVETARKIGARSVILKPFDDLEVIEAEINKALRAAKTARADRNGNGAGASPAIAATRAPGPAAAPAAAPAPPAAPAARGTVFPPPAWKAPPPPSPKGAAGAAPKPALWPVPRPAAPQPARTPVAPPDAEISKEPAAPPVSSGAQELPDSDTWRSDLTGNDTPPAAPSRPPVAAQSAPNETVPDVAPAANPSRRPQPAPDPAPLAVAPPAHHGAARPATQPAHADPGAVHEVPDEEIPEMPSDLEAIFRTATSFDTGKMRMQVPIICLQTWEERGAIAALRRLSAQLHREFYVWSAARGLIKEGGQAMGETYRDAGRALEFMRRQKNNGLYVLADFRPCLDDKTVVRVLREMVMDLETSRLMLVLTAPRLPAPPELAQACMTFDWPAGGGVDLKALYQEVVAEVAATTGRVVRLDAPSRDLLLKTMKDMPAGRARFEIARALMSAKPSS